MEYVEKIADKINTISVSGNGQILGQLKQILLKTKTKHSLYIIHSVLFCRYLNMKKLLFVCSRNKRRSLTAEKIFSENQDWLVKSCGTNSGARIKITPGLIGWADIIIFMEKRHKEITSNSFKDLLHKKQIHVLNIKDIYEYMDSKLIEKLKLKMSDLNLII